jgi:hypothetical protein
MASLNRFYLDNIAPAKSTQMVDIHRPIHGGRVDGLCNVTAAALAWLITGVDMAAPFSNAWYERGQDGTGPDGVDRIVAYSDTLDRFEDTGEEVFDDNYMLIMLHRNGKTLLIDSDWQRGRGMTVREVDAPPPQPDNGRVRHIRLFPIP